MSKDLKDKLLQTGYFEDNEYLELYIKLMIVNKNRLYLKKSTNKHHIIPKSYYKMSNIPIDNSKENLINLLYKDHILAHYYLCLCTINELKQKQVFAFFSLVNRRWCYKNFVPETDLTSFQDLFKLKCETISKMNKGRSVSEEFRDKCRKRMLGKKLPSAGKKKSKKIICIETQQIFNSLQEANKWLGVQVIPALKHYNNQETVKGYHWAYLDDIETQVKYEKFKYKEPHILSKRKVKCVETNIEFDSVAEAVRWLHKNNKRGDVESCIRGKQQTAGGYHWLLIKNSEGVSYISEE